VIREFVEDGGVVVADVRPGIYNGHCKPLADGMLDDVFGIDASGRAPAAISTATVGDLTVENAKVDPTISLTTASASGDADGTPVWIENRFGDGAAVLLNMDAGSFPKISTVDAPPAADELAQRLISRSGAHAPPVDLQGEDGLRLQDIEVVRWQDGANEIMALFRTSGTRELATIDLPQARHVYNLRTGEDLGMVDRFQAEIIPMRATFLALLPGEMPQPRLTLADESVSRGEVATASLSVPGANSLYAFRIRVHANGEHLEWLDDVIVTGPDPAEIELPVAINDPAGDYEVQAIELFSNSGPTATLRVN
jgi:hypothetical protein